jgi:TolA-binding protein
MKKIFFISVLLGIMCDLNAQDGSLEDLSESVRILTGKVEEMENKLKETQNKLDVLVSAKAEEDAVRRDAEIIANKTPEEILKTAKDMIKDKKTNEARSMFNAFISKNPRDIFCGMMEYYVAKSFIKDGDKQNAAIWFMKSFKTNPKGAKVPKTLYKLALCFKELSETVKCKSTLEKIISDYPGMFAQKAKKELAKLK